MTGHWERVFAGRMAGHAMAARCAGSANPRCCGLGHEAVATAPAAPPGEPASDSPERADGSYSNTRLRSQTTSMPTTPWIRVAMVCA